MREAAPTSPGIRSKYVSTEFRRVHPSATTTSPAEETTVEPACCTTATAAPATPPTRRPTPPPTPPKGVPVAARMDAPTSAPAPDEGDPCYQHIISTLDTVTDARSPPTCAYCGLTLAERGRPDGQREGRRLTCSIRTANCAPDKVRCPPSGALLSRTPFPVPDASRPSSTQALSSTPPL